VNSLQTTLGSITRQQLWVLWLFWPLENISKPNILPKKRQTPAHNFSQAFVSKPTPCGRLFYGPMQLAGLKLFFTKDHHDSVSF
jgi:hypothetical protein